MSEHPGNKIIPIVLSIIMLSITTVSVTYAITTGSKVGVIEREQVSIKQELRNDQDRIQSIDIDRNILITKIDALRDSLGEVKDLIKQHVRGN
jgi:hypothetical protein